MVAVSSEVADPLRRSREKEDRCVYGFAGLLDALHTRSGLQTEIFPSCTTTGRTNHHILHADFVRHSEVDAIPANLFRGKKLASQCQIYLGSILEAEGTPWKGLTRVCFLGCGRPWILFRRLLLRLLSPAWSPFGKQTRPQKYSRRAKRATTSHSRYPLLFSLRQTMLILIANYLQQYRKSERKRGNS
jgi:hypothetical protein